MSADGSLPKHTSKPEAWLAKVYPRLAIVAAIGFFAQYYMVYAKPYINMARYAAGTERMPFQARELMRYPLSWFIHSAFLERLTAGHHGSGTPALLFTEVSVFVSLALSCVAAEKIYHWAEPDAPIPLLPSALLVVICLFDYCLSVPYSFPYDLPSVAFIAWGLWFLLTDRFWALLLLFPFATWNRETSIFLILTMAAIASSRSGRAWQWRSLRSRDLGFMAFLCVIWVTIFAYLQRKYAGNPTEAGSRILGNLHDLANPIHWFSLLSASAFLIPYVWLGRQRLRQSTLRACVFLLPFWFAFLLWKGQILEVRIYGDVSVLIAVAAALLISSSIGASRRSVPFADSRAQTVA